MMLQAMIWLTAGTVVGLVVAHGWVPTEQIFINFVTSLKEIIWQLQSYISQSFSS